MPRVGFELKIQLFEREKKANALDRAATGIGTVYSNTGKLLPKSSALPRTTTNSRAGKYPNIVQSRDKA
jgi:hypothetical protein